MDREIAPERAGKRKCPPSLALRLQTAAIWASNVLADAFYRSSQRRRLMELSDLGLRDIGISRADAWAEYRKPFWRR